MLDANEVGDVGGTRKGEIRDREEYLIPASSKSRLATGNHARMGGDRVVRTTPARAAFRHSSDNSGSCAQVAQDRDVRRTYVDQNHERSPSFSEAEGHPERAQESKSRHRIRACITRHGGDIMFVEASSPVLWTSIGKRGKRPRGAVSILHRHSAML